MVTINPIIAKQGIDVGGVPNTQFDTSLGRALENFGGAISNAGETFARIDLARERQNQQIDEFRANQGFERFSSDMSLAAAEHEQNVDPSGQGLTEAVSSDFNQRAETFLKTVPDALKPKFSELLRTSREQWINKAAAAEIDQRNKWYKDGITQTQERLQNQVFNDPTQLQASIDEGNRAIDASGLPPTDKKTLKETWAKTLALTKGEREARDALNNPSSATGAADRLGISGAQNLVDRIIGAESGGNPNASNPRSSASGVGQFLDSTWLAMVRKYRPDLANRKPSEILALKSNPTIAKEMTAAYAKENADFLQTEGLPATDANIYLAHFLGPRGATQVLKADPSTPVANIVGEDVVNANPFLKGMSASQVAAWAAKKMGSATSHEPVDPAYAPLSLSDRLKIYDKINAEAQKGLAAIQAQNKTAYDDHMGSVRLGIETGDIASRQTILTDPTLKDADKATLLSALDTKLKEGADVSAYIAAWSAQSDAAKINPFDTKESALNEKAFEQVMKTVPEEQSQAVAENWIKTTGNVPKPVVANVQKGLNSTNAADVANGMAEAARIYQIAPTALEAVPNGKDVKDAALAYNEYVYGRGLSSQEAGSRWLNLHSPEAVQQRERLKKPAEDFLKTLSVTDVTSALDTSSLPFTSPSAGLTPDQQASVMADYSQIAEEKFLQTGGDADLAKKLALQEVTKLYGVSDVSGSGVVMKFPPEHYYPAIAGSQDYIRDAALKDAQEVVSRQSLPEGVLGDAMRQYPLLRGEKIAVAQSPQAEADGRVLESWPAGETGTTEHPRPKSIPLDQFGVEVFGDGVSANDVAADIVSHHLVNTDPTLKKDYQQFVKTFDTPEGQSRLRADYQWSKENEGETRPFKEWAEATRIPAYFRGYVFNQWHDKAKQGMFNDAQRSILDRMSSYLKAPGTTAPEDHILNINLVPTKETADDIRLGNPPRYKLMFQREDGVWDAVPGQLFSVPADEIKSMMQKDSQKRLDAAKAVHQQLLDEQAASDKALATTVGPDWMKARAAQAATERQKMKSDEKQLNQGDQGKFRQEFIKGLEETIANPPPF